MFFHNQISVSYLKRYIGKRFGEVERLQRIPVVEMLSYEHCHFHWNCNQYTKVSSYRCREKTKNKIHLQVNMVGIIAVNIVNSVVKNIQPALLVTFDASLPMS